eukprot:745894-Hanusia_phi.AAC.1
MSIPDSQAAYRLLVKSMAPWPLFSSNWFRMLEGIQQITDAAVLESKNVDRDTQSSTTLWERNEQIVRFILEEGKLNLTLRLLVDFKDLQRQEQFASKLNAARQAEPNATFDDLSTIKIKAALYEQTLGVLMLCSIMSIEALQVIDFPLFIDHIGKSLEFALMHPEMVRSPDSYRRQEVLAVSYTFHILEALEQLQEDRVMEVMLEKKVLPSLVRNVVTYHPYYQTNVKKNAVMVGCCGRCSQANSLQQAISAFLNTEAFKTNQNAFLQEDEIKTFIVSLQENLIQVYLMKDTLKPDELQEYFADYSKKKLIRVSRVHWEKHDGDAFGSLCWITSRGTSPSNED